MELSDTWWCWHEKDSFLVDRCRQFCHHEKMTAQDAQDIVQMNSLGNEVPVTSGEKKRGGLLWVVLGCVVVGVGLGVFVYQQSLKPAIKPSPTPKTSVVKPSIAPVASIAPVPSAVVPQTNEVSAAANTVTFPKKGKLRIYNNLNNLQMVVKIVTGGTTKTVTIANKAVSTTVPMNYGDSTFEVEAGSTGTVESYLNSVSGPKLKGWVVPTDLNKKVCGVNGAEPLDYEPEMNFVTSKLSGESIFGWQCWEDDDTPGEFNDVYMLWTYVPATTTASSSPVASVKASASPSPSPSASAKASPSPSVKVSASPSPSASAKASTAAATVATPTPSPRAAMPDTSDGVPVTGVFEVTLGTISVGLILLVLGFVGLITL